LKLRCYVRLNYDVDKMVEEPFFKSMMTIFHGFPSFTSFNLANGFGEGFNFTR
jgi:hypothetical protein